MGVARGLKRGLDRAGSEVRARPMVGSWAREVCRVGAGVGVGEEEDEAGRESRRRREDRAGCRGAGVMEGFCAGAGERGGKEELLGEGRVDIFGVVVGWLGGGLRRRGLDGCDDVVRVGGRRGEGGVDGKGRSVSV